MNHVAVDVGLEVPPFHGAAEMVRDPRDRLV